jgi:hypothetical protein
MLPGATTGINLTGDVPRGARFRYFFETKQDLLNGSVPFFRVCITCTKNSLTPRREAVQV